MMSVIRFQPDHLTQRVEALKVHLQRTGWSYSDHTLGSFRVLVLPNHDSAADAQLAQMVQWSGGELLSDLPPYPLASRALKPECSRISIGGQTFGGDAGFGVIAGPCAIENENQIHQVAREIARCGIRTIRGGAFKPRTSPYSFQGLEKAGLEMIAQAAYDNGLSIITELMDISLLEAVYPYTDVIQVGTRNMSNFHMLKALGRQDKPVLLKRGMSATVKEWLLAAEYILSSGNDKVILCERGIRTFDTTLRNTFDLPAIKVAQSLSHLPVIADPSHGTGDRRFVPDMAVASYAAGADGLMFEVHPRPEEALSDGEQSLDLEGMRLLMDRLSGLSDTFARPINLKTHDLKNSNLCVE